MASLYTLAEIDAAVLARLEDNSTFWQQPERNTIINEAIRCTNLLTGFYQGSATTTSVANQLTYAIPAGVLYPQRVTLAGIQLDPVPITHIGQDYRTWATDQSATKGQTARWVPIGTTLFALHPADSASGDTIAVYGVVEPPLLVSPSDTMILDDQYVDIIVEYCASRLPLKIGGQNFQQASMLYTKSFQPGIKKLTNLQTFRFPKYWVNAGAPVPEGKIQ